MTTRQNGKRQNDLAAWIYRRLKGARGLDDDELWQHALFFALSPEQRCRLSLQTARSALSAGRDKDVAVLPILERTQRLVKRLKTRERKPRIKP